MILISLRHHYEGPHTQQFHPAAPSASIIRLLTLAVIYLSQFLFLRHLHVQLVFIFHF